MSETQALFAALRETADAATAAAIERLIKSGADRNLVRINVLAFAAACGLDEEHLPNKVCVQKRGDGVLFTT